MRGLGRGATSTSNSSVRSSVPTPHSSRLAQRTWLFDLDNTLHDASHAAFGEVNSAMNAYLVEHLRVDEAEAGRMRLDYLHRYGATLLGLVRHHGVKASHFLEQTHRHPGLESRLRTSAHDRAVLKRLRGRKYIVTNAPRHYALRVLDTLRLTGLFDDVISIEDMTMFGHLRPKPDARMLRTIAVRLKVPVHRCVLVEDTVGHQKSARRIGMRTVWMQRWLRDGIHGPEAGLALARRPVYVCARIRSLQALARWR